MCGHPAPEVVEAILAGRIRANIDQKVLLSADGIPADWREQDEKLVIQD